MTKIAITPFRCFDDLIHLNDEEDTQYEKMTSVEVQYESSFGNAILLRLGPYDTRNPLLVVPLTPPAAHQLSEALSQAVQDYLRSEPPEKE